MKTKLRAYNLIGNIAVLNLPKELEKKEKQLAKKLLQQKNIQTVAKKTGNISGELRTSKIKIIAGKKSKETIHKENNTLIKLNIQTSYFSPRLSNERLEITKAVKPKEKILVMFAGVGPYALTIAKNSQADEIYAIELNKTAIKYFQSNIELNKLSNIKVIQGDVKKVVPRFQKQKKKFDRIIMPRPQLKETFLKQALAVSKKGTIIHFYDFLKEDQIKEVKEKIKATAEKAGKKIRILKIKKAGELAPYKFRIRADFKIL